MPSKNVNPSALVDTVISVAAHVEAELEEALAEHRLTRPSFLVLDALERAGGHTLSQRDLVGRVRRTSGTLSVRLGRLERARLIAREPDPENRRSVTVTLTERGAALVKAARPAYAERAQRLAGGLPDGATGALGQSLPAWLEFFEPGEGAETPRLGVAVATAAVAKRMRRAVGLRQPRRRRRAVARGPDHRGRRCAGALGRRSGARRPSRRCAALAHRAAGRRLASGGGHAVAVNAAAPAPRSS
jgi:DNA-binding MarR family transcriptional regulator